MDPPLTANSIVHGLLDNCLRSSYWMVRHLERAIPFVDGWQVRHHTNHWMASIREMRMGSDIVIAKPFTKCPRVDRAAQTFVESLE